MTAGPVAGPDPGPLLGEPVVTPVDTPHGPARVSTHHAPDARALLLLGHGAGGGIAAPDLVATTRTALAAGVSVGLVEQPYRVAGRRAPAPAGQLDTAWLAVVAAVRSGAIGLPPVGSVPAVGPLPAVGLPPPGPPPLGRPPPGPSPVGPPPGGVPPIGVPPIGLPLLFGGRSSGARVACRNATAGGAAGVLCLAFPVHPPGRPEKDRLAELAAPTVPVLVVQGENDPFGRPPPAPGRAVVLLRGDHSLRSDLPGLRTAVRDWLRERSPNGT